MSIPYHILLAAGFGILISTAIIEDSLIFLVKQIATFIPVVIIIGQIFYHKKDHWHDDHDLLCKQCDYELEPELAYCPWCGAQKVLEHKNPVKKSK